MEAINQCDALIQKLQDKEFIKEHVKKMDGYFIQNMPPELYSDTEFLIKITFLNSNSLGLIIANSTNLDLFLKLLLDKLKENVAKEFDFYKLEKHSKTLIKICKCFSLTLNENEEFLSQIKIIFNELIHNKELPYRQTKNLAKDVLNIMGNDIPRLAFPFKNKPFLEKILKGCIPNPCDVIPPEYLADQEYLRKLISLSSSTTKRELSKYKI